MNEIFDILPPCSLEGHRIGNVAAEQERFTAFQYFRLTG